VGGHGGEFQRRDLTEEKLLGVFFNLEFLCVEQPGKSF